jgi:hypothetical protein
MTPNPAVEDIELSLIQADTNDAIRALLSHIGDEASAVLSLVTLPMGGLVAEESYRYFSRSRRAERLGSLDSDLFNIYGHSLTKVRARLKLFDDTDAGPAILSRS